MSPLSQFYSIALISACLASIAQAVSVNDSIEQAFRLHQAGYVVGDNTGATKDASEPRHGGMGDGRSLWWHWQGAGGEILTLRGLGEARDYILVVYERALGGELTERAQVVSRDGAPVSLDVNAVFAGQDLWLAVDSVEASSGGVFYFSVDQAPEIHAPLQVRVKPGVPIEVPVKIAGLPDQIRLDLDREGFVYDRQNQQIRGALPLRAQDERRIEIVADNQFGGHSVYLDLVLDDAQPLLTSPASATGFMGHPFEYVLEFDGGKGSTPDSVNFSGLPEGFVAVLENGVWTVKGIPEFEGDAWFQVSSFHPDRAGSDTEARITLNVISADNFDGPPGIISPASARAQVGQAFRYQIETQFPASGFQAFGLPDGLSLNENGLISGIPEQSVPRIQIIANRNFGPDSSATLDLDFNSPAVPEVDLPPVVIAYRDVPFVRELAFAGVDTLNVNGLPPGLAYNASARVISGTPSQSGSFDVNFNLQSAHTSGADFTTQFQVLDSDSLRHIVSPAQMRGEVGVFLEYPLQFAPTPPDASTTVAVLRMPEGLQYDSTTHRIFGVPLNQGIQGASLRIGDRDFNLQFIIDAPSEPPVFTSAAEAVGRQDAFFYFSLNASGRSTYSIISGALPAGLSLNGATGAISGTPTVAGESRLTVEAMNEHGIRSISRLAINIVPPTTNLPEIILSPGQLSGLTGETLVYAISSSGDTFGSFSVEGLPSGFFFDAGNGIIFGSRETSTRISFSVRHGLAEAEVLLDISEPAESATGVIVTSAPSLLGEFGQSLNHAIELSPLPDGVETSFHPDLNWPSTLNLDESTGVVSGHLGEDWAPRLGFTVRLNGSFATESVLNIIPKGRDRPILLNSPAYTRYFEGDLVDFVFEPADPSAEVVVFDRPFTYDATQRRFFGYATQTGRYEIDFEVRDTQGIKPDLNGRVVIEVTPGSEKPNPQLQSPLAPVAVAGEFFEWPIVFDQPGVTWELTRAPDWLAQTGSSTLGGFVASGFGSDLIELQASNPHGWNDSYTLSIDYGLLNRPLPANLISPASAVAYIGEPFEYFLEFDHLIDMEQLYVNLPDWLRLDTATLRLHGTPSEPGKDTVLVEMWTLSGERSEAELTIQIVGDPQRPLFVGHTPPPAFIGFPYAYDFSVQGSTDGLFSDLSSPLEIDWNAPRLEAMPISIGDPEFRLEAINSRHATVIEGNIRIVETAPFIMRDPIDMTSESGGHAFFSAEFAGIPSETLWIKKDSATIANTETLELNAVTTSDQGAYQLSLKNSIGEAWTQPAYLTVGTPTRFRDWMLSEQGRLAYSSGRGGPSQSFAEDSVPNLIKWAMGLSLIESASRSPVVGVSAESGFEFSFPRALSAMDVTYIIECSNDLQTGSWEVVARRPAGGSWLVWDANIDLVENDSATGRMVKVQDSSSEISNFFRVRFLLSQESKASVDF